MSTTTDTTTPRPDGGSPGSKDPYIRGTEETVLLDLRELRAQEAADRAAREKGAAAGAPAAAPETSETSEPSAAASATGAELERYHGSHRRDAVLYADGGTAIPLDRVREVCHDLRQPVAAILMLASAAELRPDVPERVRAVLQEIMSQTEDISATVRQFLDDAKQGVDGLGEPVPCNVAGLAAESVERWRATFDGDLALAAADDPLHVTVDPVLFKRALGNVLSNGTRAAGDSGRVQVTVRRFQTADGERAVIEVDDSGPGFGNIPTGHGLGLAVVRRTIEAAGGWVEFADGPLGGALVRLLLPVTPIRPLSADDELTKTFHGEISLTDLAAELAAGGMHPALAEFEDADFEDYEDYEDYEDFSMPAPAPAAASGHAFTTRMSAWPEPMAISGTREQLAIGGPGGAGNPFGARAAEQAAVPGANDNRSYFGLPARTSESESEPAAIPAVPEPTTDRGFFGVPAQKSPGAEQGYFGLPLKNDNAASQPSAAPRPAEPVPEPAAEPQAPHSRLYGGPGEITSGSATPQNSDIAAHPVPTGLLSARQAATRPPQVAAEITPAPIAPAAQTSAPEQASAQAPTPHSAAAPGLATARPTTAQPFAAAQSSAPAPIAPAQAPAPHAAAASGPATERPTTAQPFAAAQSSAPAPIAPAQAPAPYSAAASGPATAQPFSAAQSSAPAPIAPAQAPSPHTAAAPGPATAHPAAAQPFAAPQPPAPATPQSPLLPAPTFDPSDTQPLHIIPTGQDDTALASIQLPSQANLTQPPRIPASALRPVAEVQLSLLPGGAF